jgi:hypothetical protein
MASVFSYYVACLHSSGDRNGQLTQPPFANHGFHSPHPIPDSSLKVELIRLLIATILQLRIRNAPHPLMEPRRMTPTCP